VRKRPVRSFAPPLDLRFIDLFMAIVLALSFVAIMLTVVARMLPTEAATPPPRQETSQVTRQELRQNVAQLKKQLDAAVAARQRAEAELRTAQAQFADQTAFALPWWLIGFCALLGVLAVFMSWRIRLWNKGNLPRLRSWLVITVVVAAVTMVIRSLSDADGYLLLAEIPWWGAAALCLGLLLVAYVLITDIRDSRSTLGKIKMRSAGGQ
jgi:ABC-type transport system involved in cytochrome bd biosynthesis fused ATPase/permease subunit